MGDGEAVAYLKIVSATVVSKGGAEMSNDRSGEQKLLP